MVQGKADLASTNWATVATFIGTGSLTNVCVPRQTNFQFLRLAVFGATSTTAPPPTLSAPVRQSGTGGVQLSSSAQAGKTYRVEYKTNLSSTTWITLTNVTASGSTVSATDSTATGQPLRFYRFVELP